LVGRFGLVAAKKRKEGFFFKKRMSENWSLHLFWISIRYLSLSIYLTEPPSSLQYVSYITGSKPERYRVEAGMHPNIKSQRWNVYHVRTPSVPKYLSFSFLEKQL
jgi:hypothetical protein